MTYFPPPHPAPWATATPADAGLDAEALAAAARHAVECETPWSRDLALMVTSDFQECPPWNETLGPVRPRGGPNGLVLRSGRIVAEWGETIRADMTFSVAKSYLAILAGLAWDRGLIRDPHEEVRRTVEDGGFDPPHNDAITWHHLLQQTSEWEGVLWDMCGWPPARKDFFTPWHQRPIAVMCPAWWRGARPQALMGSVGRGLIKPAGSHCPMSRDRYPSIRRLTDDAITLVHPRKSCVCEVLFLCSIKGPFLRPDLVPGWRRAQPRSRLAEGHRRRRARSGLDGGEHGARLAQVGARLIVAPVAKVLLAHHYCPTDACHLVGERAGGDLALFGLEQSHQPGVLLGALAAQHRHRPVDQQAAQIAVPALADRTELDLSARAVLARH